MAWFPIGPDFVFAPRNENFKRLSRRNEVGRQGLVAAIAVDPTDANVIYTAERPTSGGTSAFRTNDGGFAWSPIADALQQLDPAVDPNCFAVNPDHPATVYMGSWGNARVYVSSNRCDPGSWSPAHAIGGSPRQIVVDTRTSATLATTVLYAATSGGVFRSANGGATWGAPAVLAGDVWSLVASTPATGTAHFYASGPFGLAHSTNPSTAAGWTDLIAAGIGLPAAGTFDLILVDFCRLNPSRAYAWVLKDGATQAIYTTSSPTTAWSAVAAVSPPGPWYGYYALSYAVAPNSPGDGLNDILLFGGGSISRSIDGGRTWKDDAVWFHADQHAIAFAPASPPVGVVPATFIGCDGGLAKSTHVADPATAIDVAPPDFNEGFNVADTHAWQNLNHGKQSSAVYQYATVKGFEALSYIACQDTGVSGGASGTTWRGMDDADADRIAAAAATDSVSVWSVSAQYGGWASYRVSHYRDGGEFAPPLGFATLAGSILSRRSNFVVGLDSKCLSGVVARDVSTTLTGAVTVTGAQAVTPASMASILVGSVVTVEPDTANEDNVSVTAVSATTFTGAFARTHAAGAAAVVNRALVVRIDQAGTASQISQDFTANGDVGAVAASPINADTLYCSTSDNRVWHTSSGSTASATTVWSEVTTGRPGAPSISSIAINGADEAFVLLTWPLTVGGATSPLFKVSAGSWQLQPCSGLPTSGFGWGKLVADPLQNDVLYAGNGAHVYRLTRAGASWTCADLSDGLPGQWIYDLAALRIQTSGPPKALLRAAIPTRAIFETDVTAGAVDPPIALYVRDNLLDQSWLSPSPDGLRNPYDPTQWVTHYQCADIKIDARQNRPVAGAADFFQTDPEDAPVPPLNHVLFEELKDNSQNLPQTDAALVHAQVHNRSTTPANNVSVWAIYCNAAARVPGLNESAALGNAFPFWSQFTAAGAIVPSLPADSPWTSVGSPQMLNGLTVTSPQVASWNWTIPTLSTGSPGHFCMVVFVHSAASPITETGMIVDAITPTNKQIGQKNLHIGPPLPPHLGRGPGGGGRGGPRMREYVEFRNPTAEPSTTDVRFDLRALPPELGLTFRLTKLDTAVPLASAILGANATTATQPDPPPEPSPPQPQAAGGLLGLLELLLCWILNLLRRLVGRPPKPCGPHKRKVVQLPHFEPTVYEAEPAGLTEIRGVRLPAHSFAAVLLDIRPVGDLEPGREYRFEIQQVVPGGEGQPEQILGGGTYVVPIEGDLKRRKTPPPPSHAEDTPLDERERIEHDGEEQRLPPVWAKELVERRVAEFEL